jgi:type IV secretory pathway TraG/TraD family ATPase VirD4
LRITPNHDAIVSSWAVFFLLCAIVDWLIGLCQGPAPPAPPNLSRLAFKEFDRMGNEPDPYRELRQAMRRTAPKSLHIGVTAQGWTATAPESNLLVLGPSRAGKTSGILVPQILLALGPVVALTTKGADLLVPTAQSRARLGRIWHYRPAGGEEIPGTTELRWSPLQGAQDWDAASRTAQGFVDVVPKEGNHNAEFWDTQAVGFLSIVFYGTALLDEDVDFALDAAFGLGKAMAKIEAVIFEKGTRQAQRYMSGYLDANEKLQRDVRTTAQNALSGFRLQSAIDSTKDPTFDVTQFVKGSGEPAPDMVGEYGYDTVYITAPPDDQKIVCPLLVCFLSVLRRARFKVYEDDRKKSQHPAMFWALDEVASMARMRALPELAAQSASTGLFMTICLRDWSGRPAW